MPRGAGQPLETTAILLRSGTIARAQRPRPRLLFLAWSFPPVHVISSVRTWNVAKYLSRLGWDVTVVTPEPKLRRHLQDREKTKANLEREGIRQVLTDHRWRFLAADEFICWNQGLGRLFGGVCRVIARRVGIDRGIGWIKAADEACSALNSNDVDLIFASGPPFAVFMLAERVSRRLGRPYVLDYRDPVSVQDVIRPLQRVVKQHEGRLVRNAAAVTTVSPSWASDLDSRFAVGSRVKVVANGFDPEELTDVHPHEFGHFAIVYAGIFYPPMRVVTPVLEALHRLKTQSGIPWWYFHYYGDHDSHVRQEATRIGVMDHVKLHGRVPRSEVLAAISGAALSVVITSVLDEATPEVLGWVPGKLFEIMGLASPILLIAPPDCNVETFAAAGGYVHRCCGSDINGIARFVEQLMSGSKRANSKLHNRYGDRFAWHNLAKVLDSHLRAQLTESEFHEVSK